MQRLSRRALVFIHLYLAVQIALPLTYYNLRRDKYDERFAWRMFSSVRTLQCKVEVIERDKNGAGQKVDPSRIVPGTWVKHLQRAQPRVVAHYLESRCTPDMQQVVMTRSCRNTDTSRGPSSRWFLDCHTGELSRQGVGAR